MPRKRHKPEEIVAKLRQVDVLVSQGQALPRRYARLGLQVTYYRWRQEFGGLKSDQAKRLKALETENTRLRRAIADLTLDKLILAGGSPGKLLLYSGSEIQPPISHPRCGRERSCGALASLRGRLEAAS